jgi:glycine/D-amino acid oxidase-like deaminating enzyme
MPVISKASIKNVSAGIPTFTQDLRFIADKVGDGSNLFVITACQETGITHGPALGNRMADFISTNTSSPELKSFKITDFKELL